MMALQLYNGYKVNAMKGAIALLTDSIYCALLASSFTPNIATQKFFSDVNASESSGTGYTAGGQILSSPTVTEDDTNSRAVFDAADTSWANSTIANARYAVIYKNTGSAATSPLIGYIDLLSTKSTNGDTFYIQWNTLGIFNLT